MPLPPTWCKAKPATIQGPTGTKKTINMTPRSIERPGDNGGLQDESRLFFVSCAFMFAHA